ncbi:hypothetical protein HDU93_009619, partial [Gonapodya sp. JEL0774]
ANGQVGEAVTLLEHVVAVQSTILAEDHPYRLKSQNNLALAYEANGQVGKAVTLLEHVVAVHERVLAEDHPDRLTSQNNLADAYQDDGQVDKAAELLEHVVTIRERVLTEDHPDRLASQIALTGVYLATLRAGSSSALFSGSSDTHFRETDHDHELMVEDGPDEEVPEAMALSAEEHPLLFDTQSPINGYNSVDSGVPTAAETPSNESAPAGVLWRLWISVTGIFSN